MRTSVLNILYSSFLLHHIVVTQALQWFQNILIDGFLPRIVYLTNLDYRQGLINFEDLNSDRSYDPATAFYQVIFRVTTILDSRTLTEVFSESACQYPSSPVAVQGVPGRQGNVPYDWTIHSVADWLHPLDHGLCSLSGSLWHPNWKVKYGNISWFSNLI